jgi:hypothetical protein
MMKHMTNNQYKKLTEGIIGLPVSYTWRGHGSAIFIEFGTLSKEERRNHPQGEFSLMLDCGWRIENPRSIFLGSYSGRKRIDNQLEKLVGSLVTKIELVGYLPEVIIHLDSNVRVVSFTNSEGQPVWTLFLPDNSWLHCRNGIIKLEKPNKGIQTDSVW